MADTPFASTGAWAFKQNVQRRNKLWIYFMENDHNRISKVLTVIKEWSDCCAIRFSQTNDKRGADIIVTFAKPDESYWDPTTHELCLGWLEDGPNPTAEDRHVILHEFGHALGFEHEQQHPGRPFTINPKAAYDYYKCKGWDKDETDFNVLTTPNEEDDIVSTEYDQMSVMHYMIPKRILEGTDDPSGYIGSRSPTLSQRDRDLALKLYPYANTPSSQPSPSISEPGHLEVLRLDSLPQPPRKHKRKHKHKQNHNFRLRAANVQAEEEDSVCGCSVM